MLHKLLSYKQTSLAELPIRLMLAAIFIYHGFGKVTRIEGTIGFFTKMGLEPAVPLAYLAAYGELIGGILIGLGLFTRLAALNCVVIILVAIFTVHVSQGFKGMEFQLLILASSLQLLMTGSGKVSIDHVLRSKRLAE